VPQPINLQLSRRAFVAGLAALGVGAACGIGSTTTGTVASPSRRGSPLGPLRADAGRLIDAAGQEVRLTGVNWFGLETSNFAPHGLWARNWGDMLDQIVSVGFNSLRLPFSNQLFEMSSVPNSIDLAQNPDLKGASGLDLLDRIIEGAAARGLRVVLDRHRPTADAQSELWYTDRIPESRWIDDWVMLARRYRKQPAVVGADLHNEPHGPASWGDGNPRTDWRLAAERVGDAILAANPNWLIVVEGIERFGSDSYWWGGNLKGARSAPVRLSRPENLVYSAHDYGPAVYQQPWFQAADFPRNLPTVWQEHWAYLAIERTAPVLVGEFGGRSVGTDPEGAWQRELVAFLKESGSSYTYWAWNPDSGDTGGILEDDWKSVDPAKIRLLAGYQWARPSAAARIGEEDAA
jgi:endoglucanase